MTVENTKGEAQPADDTTQQIGAGTADEGIAALEQLMVVDDPATQEASTQEQTQETKAEEADDAEEPADDADEEEDTEESEGDEDDGEEAGEKPHAAPRAEKRIHKLTAQRNEAREKAAKAEAELKAAKEAAVANIALDPSYLTESQIAQIKHSNQVLERRNFLVRHLGVGFEDEKNPQNSLTAKDVAEEFASLERFMPQVAESQRIYDEAKRQQAEDWKAGRMLRLSKQALNKNKKPAPTVKTTQASSTATRSVAVSPVPKRGMSVDRFAKAGGTDDAALRELEELVPG